MSETYQQALNQVFNDLRGELIRLLKSLGGSNVDQATKSHEKLVSHVHDLIRIIPSDNQPQWLLGLRDQLKRVTPKSDPGTLNVQLAEHYGRVAPISVVDFEEDQSDVDYDFDAIFAELRQQSNITSLFDSMVDSITDMIANDQIDNTYALDALTKLQALVKANRDGSFSSYRAILSTMDFYKRSLWRYAEGNKHLKPFLETFDEMHEEMNLLQDQFQRAATRRVISDKTLNRLRKLEGNEQLALPGAETQSADDQIEDADFEMKEETQS